MHHTSKLLAAGLTRRELTELIDVPGVAEADVLANLRDLSRINALGGVALSAWALHQFVQSAQLVRQNTSEPFVQNHIRLLDIGCGLGDIPRALVQNSDVAVHLSVTATDLNPTIVHMAQAADPERQVAYAAAHGLRLPFTAGSFEIVHCSFTLHHFMPAEATALLVEMRRVARVGLIVNDLVRSWPGIGGAWLLGRLSHNPLTRHDGLASARRAYTHAELRALAAQAGLRVIAARELVGYRVALAMV